MYYCGPVETNILPAADGSNMEGELSALESTSLTERVVLLALADAAVEDEAPVASVDVRPRCLRLCRHVEAEMVSPPGEPDIMRALSMLGTEPYVEERQPNSSPVGKGRPQYDLTADPEAVLDALADDERLEEPIEAVRDN